MRSAALIPAANDDFSLSLSIPAIAPFVDEVIVLDDQSCDATNEVLAHLGEQCANLRVHYSDKPMGWTEARNRLMELSAARHLLFIDADDILCEWQADELLRLMHSGRPRINLGLLEAVGDFQHGTGRGVEWPHYDKCHCYIDRETAGHVRWHRKNTFSYISTGARPVASGQVLFVHAKGVKSDWRLCWRSRIRAWMRRGQLEEISESPEQLHHIALQTLLSNSTNPLRRLPPHVRLPEICQASKRFEMVYSANTPIDRLDRGFNV